MIDNCFHPLIPLDMGPLEYFSVLGRALFTSQHFETNCRALAGYMDVRKECATKGSDVLDTHEFSDKIDKVWRSTLGGTIRNLSGKIEFPNHIKAALEDARKARNEIAHWVTVGVRDELDSELDTRIQEIRTHVRQIALADRCIAALIHAIRNDPLPSLEFFDEYATKVANWVCEPAFDEIQG